MCMCVCVCVVSMKIIVVIFVLTRLLVFSMVVGKKLIGLSFMFDVHLSLSLSLSQW